MGIPSLSNSGSPCEAHRLRENLDHVPTLSETTSLQVEAGAPTPRLLLEACQANTDLRAMLQAPLGEKKISGAVLKNLYRILGAETRIIPSMEQHQNLRVRLYDYFEDSLTIQDLETFKADLSKLQIEPLNFSRLELIGKLQNDLMAKGYKVRFCLDGDLLFPCIHERFKSHYGDVTIYLLLDTKEHLAEKDYEKKFVQNFREILSQFFGDAMVGSLGKSLKSLCQKSPIAQDQESKLMEFIVEFGLEGDASYIKSLKILYSAMLRIFVSEEFSLSPSNDVDYVPFHLGCGSSCDTKLKILFTLPQTTVRKESVLIELPNEHRIVHHTASLPLFFGGDSAPTVEVVNEALLDIAALRLECPVVDPSSTRKNWLLFPRTLLNVSSGCYLEKDYLKDHFFIPFSKKKNYGQYFYKTLETLCPTDNPLLSLVLLWNYHVLNANPQSQSFLIERIKRGLCVHEEPNDAILALDDQLLLMALSALFHMLAKEKFKNYLVLESGCRVYGCYLLEDTPQEIIYDEWLKIPERNLLLNRLCQALLIDERALSLLKEKPVRPPAPSEREFLCLLKTMNKEEKISLLAKRDLSQNRIELTNLHLEEMLELMICIINHTDKTKEAEVIKLICDFKEKISKIALPKLPLECLIKLLEPPQDDKLLSILISHHELFDTENLLEKSIHNTPNTLKIICHLSKYPQFFPAIEKYLDQVKFNNLKTDNQKLAYYDAVKAFCERRLATIGNDHIAMAFDKILPLANTIIKNVDKYTELFNAIFIAFTAKFTTLESQVQYLIAHLPFDPKAEFRERNIFAQINDKIFEITWEKDPHWFKNIFKYHNTPMMAYAAAHACKTEVAFKQIYAEFVKHYVFQIATPFGFSQFSSDDFPEAILMMFLRTVLVLGISSKEQLIQQSLTFLKDNPNNKNYNFFIKFLNNTTVYLDDKEKTFFIETVLTEYNKHLDRLRTSLSFNQRPSDQDFAAKVKSIESLKQLLIYVINEPINPALCFVKPDLDERFGQFLASLAQLDLDSWIFHHTCEITLPSIHGQNLLQLIYSTLVHNAINYQFMTRDGAGLDRIVSMSKTLICQLFPNDKKRQNIFYLRILNYLKDQVMKEGKYRGTFNEMWPCFLSIYTQYKEFLADCELNDYLIHAESLILDSYAFSCAYRKEVPYVMKNPLLFSIIKARIEKANQDNGTALFKIYKIIIEQFNLYKKTNPFEINVEDRLADEYQEYAKTVDPLALPNFSKNFRSLLTVLVR